MPLFQFDNGGPTTVNSVSASIGITDQAVNFTLSTTGNLGPVVVVRHSPSNVTDTGRFTLSDNFLPAPFTLDPTNTLQHFATTGGKISLQLASLSGTWDVTFVNTATALADQKFSNVAANQLLTFSSAHLYTAIRFTPSALLNRLVVDSLNASVTCYLQGTRIATPTGEAAVETLREGDRVLTADGGQTIVQWLGEQSIAPRFRQPGEVNPICITAGAIAENVPSRDLHVSPDHAIEIDGMFINASALVNGSTIYQVAKMPLEGFTYYHVETEAHELILAENCPAESYLDMPSREMFDNGAERADGPVIQEMDLPRISSARLVPEHIRERISERASVRVATLRLAG